LGIEVAKPNYLCYKKDEVEIFSEPANPGQKAEEVQFFRGYGRRNQRAKAPRQKRASKKKEARKE
jgi:hypothetical protein